MALSKTQRSIYCHLASRAVLLKCKWDRLLTFLGCRASTAFIIFFKKSTDLE